MTGPTARRWTTPDALIDLGHLTGTAGRSTSRKDGGSCDGWRLMVKRRDNGAVITVTYLGETVPEEELQAALDAIGAEPVPERKPR